MTFYHCHPCKYDLCSKCGGSGKEGVMSFVQIVPSMVDGFDSSSEFGGEKTANDTKISRISDLPATSTLVI